MRNLHRDFARYARQRTDDTAPERHHRRDALGSTARQTIPKRADINTLSPKSIQAPLLITGVAAILLSAVAMAVVPVMGWGKSPFAGFEGNVALAESPEIPAEPLLDGPSGAGQGRVKARCDECGEVTSMRRVVLAGNLDRKSVV